MIHELYSQQIIRLDLRHIVHNKLIVQQASLRNVCRLAQSIRHEHLTYLLTSIWRRLSASLC